MNPIIFAFIAVVGLCGAVWYALRYLHLKSQRERQAFAPRIQTPAQKELALLRQKQAAFDAGDDRELSMLLKRNAP